MNNDLISRSALLAALVEGGILPAMVRRTIENAPAVDAATGPWTPVTDRLPDPWEEVLAFSNCDFFETAVYLGIPGEWRVTWNHDFLEHGSITHWMPLPEKPKGEDYE